MDKSRSLFFWSISFILSFVCLITALPIVLFILYPYSIIVIGVYAALIVLLSVLSFRNNTNKQTTSKRVLFSMLLAPIVALLIILVAIETGWLHYPG